jgi:methionine sulfoxide reductase heme-binding subunit
MSDQILWFATRGAGIVSLLLFTAVFALGILTVTRWQSAAWPRFLTVGLHRNLALLSVAFLAAHILTAIADPFTALGVAAAAIPFASSYRPLAVGLGVIAFDLLLAVAATSLVRERIGQRAWRLVHWSAYAAWPLALAHGIEAGSDSGAVWMLPVYGLCLAVVGLALAWRVRAGGSNRQVLAALTAGAAAGRPAGRTR